MLFNATQQEELRVAIVEGKKLVDIDIESAGREQRKGNIYKGLITRVEPSLDAYFVNYGEDKHGFLPFKEVAKTSIIRPGTASVRKTQELLKEGMEIICQVEKEERGTKGAALTTLISLAGRYLVLMPNNARGGGVSRRIEGEERQELRETIENLALPNGMSVIVRTAGIGRTLEELQWDLNYLLQLWNAIEIASKEQSAPLLIYLESSLVIRAIRDYFQPDIDEILIDTHNIYEQAKTFMGMVMPDNLIKVKHYTDDIPLFSRFQIEQQIESAYARTVTLPSGGSIVLDSTEALVAIDVNSARATRGADIEETALRTNLEAVDEAARQMRLRDLGGLIVIDFIDMDSPKCQREVEHRLKEVLHMDRARVQMAKISRFGLMELSRQRLRPALSEGSRIACPRCSGTGHIRDVESSSLQLLRSIQEESVKDNSSIIRVQAPIEVCTYLFNEKRTDLNDIETRLNIQLILIPNKHLAPPNYQLERVKEDANQINNAKPSYKFIEEASLASEHTFDPIKRELEPRNKPQAAVKGITPDHPAPSRLKQEQTIQKYAPNTNTLNKIMHWMTAWFRSTPHAIQSKQQSLKNNFESYQQHQMTDFQKQRSHNKKHTNTETSKSEHIASSQFEITPKKKLALKNEQKLKNRLDNKSTLQASKSSDASEQKESISLVQSNETHTEILSQPTIITTSENLIHTSSEHLKYIKNQDSQNNEKRHKRNKRNQNHRSESINSQKEEITSVIQIAQPDNTTIMNNTVDKTLSTHLQEITSNHEAVMQEHTSDVLLTKEIDNKKTKKRVRRISKHNNISEKYHGIDNSAVTAEQNPNELIPPPVITEITEQKIDVHGNSNVSQKENIALYMSDSQQSNNIIQQPINSSESNNSKLTQHLAPQMQTSTNLNCDIQTISAQNLHILPIADETSSTAPDNEKISQTLSTSLANKKNIKYKQTTSNLTRLDNDLLKTNTTQLLMIQTKPENKKSFVVTCATPTNNILITEKQPQQLAKHNEQNNKMIQIHSTKIHHAKSHKVSEPTTNDNSIQKKNT